MDLNELDVTRTYQATVRESERLTPAATDEVRHIVLSVADPGFGYRVGQSVGVLVPGPHPFGNRHHLRLYSVADGGGEPGELGICVRRCFYIDEVSGERCPGIASNYLCDRRPGDAVTLTGPYGSHFRPPDDDTANLLMIGTGTGIAPFRAFVQHIYDVRGGWRGRVRLFYGARTGTELLYMNDVKDDLASYYQQATFKAFAALSRRPAVEAESALDRELEENAEEVWELVMAPDTYVYLAGLKKSAERLERALARIAGSEALFRFRREEMQAQGRWAELLFE